MGASRWGSRSPPWTCSIQTLLALWRWAVHWWREISRGTRHSRKVAHLARMGYSGVSAAARRQIRPSQLRRNRSVRAPLLATPSCGRCLAVWCPERGLVSGQLAHWDHCPRRCGATFDAELHHPPARSRNSPGPSGQRTLGADAVRKPAADSPQDGDVNAQSAGNAGTAQTSGRAVNRSARRKASLADEEGTLGPERHHYKKKRGISQTDASVYPLSNEACAIIWKIPDIISQQIRSFLHTSGGKDTENQ